LKRLSQKSLPASHFQREERFGRILSGRFYFFPLWKRGRKGDFTAFQKDRPLPGFELHGIPETCNV
jgi:hypothetical protein